MSASSGPVASTVPYPWPYDGALDAARTALVIAGVQPGWMADSTDGEKICAHIARLIPALQEVGVLVVCLSHVRPAHLPETAGPVRSAVPVIGTADATAIAFPGAPADLSVVAQGIDGFYASPLEAQLRAAGRTHLLMAGFAAEITVDSTLRGANDRGFECLVLTDSVAHIDPSLGAHALASVTMSGGIFGALGTSAAVLAALQPPSTDTPTTDPPAEEHP